MKLLMTSIFILLFLHCAKSQDYKPFNFDSGEWYCKYSTKGGMFGGANHGTYYAIDSVKFFSNGDTLINDVTFKKLMYSGYTSSQIVERTYISGYYGAIRNDTLKKQVYFISSDYNLNYKGTGNLLYDFDLNIGDSLQINCILDEKDKISLIDSIIYCNQYHKRYNTPSGYYIIEGIGSKNGLLPVNCLTNFGWLFCYKEENNELCAGCDFITSMDTYPTNALCLYPNPTTGVVQIDSDLSIKYIDLYDITGTLIERFYYNHDILEIKKKGCYILQIHTDKAILTAKIIKE